MVFVAFADGCNRSPYQQFDVMRYSTAIARDLSESRHLVVVSSHSYLPNKQLRKNDLFTTPAWTAVSQEKNFSCGSPNFIKSSTHIRIISIFSFISDGMDDQRIQMHIFFRGIMKTTLNGIRCFSQNCSNLVELLPGSSHSISK